MSRRRIAMAGRITKSEEQLRPDPVHNDKVLAKFINCIMYDGKKSAPSA
jgi:small subunit ribosomal protein S7